MKKVLLSLLGVLASVAMYAKYQVGEYINTTTARFQVSEEVAFPQPTLNSDAWTGINGLFDAYTAAAEDDADHNGILANKDNATAEDKIYTSFDVEYGVNYILTFNFKGTAAGNSTLTADGANYVDAWISLNDDQGVKPTDETVFKQQVATTFAIGAYEWTEVRWSFSVTDETLMEGGKLNLVFSKLPVETIIASDMQLVKVVEVYDIRPMQKRIAFVKTLMKDDNFNTAAAADAKGTLEEAIETIEAGFETGEWDAPEAGASTMEALEGYVEDFLSVTSTNINNRFSGVSSSEWTGKGKYNRGDGNLASYGNLQLVGGNWQHAANADYLYTAIQGKYENLNQVYNVYNTVLPAGKYFLKADIRNAYVGSSATYEYTWTLENVCQMFIGTDTINTDPIVGEDYQTFYMVGEVAQDGQFRVGVKWPGYSGGSAFFIKNVEIRAFNEVVEKINRAADWNTFITQYNAATNALKAINEKLADVNYPYAKDSLQNALTIWKPFYDKVLEDGWIDAEGNDTGVAKNAELLDWAKYQGVEILTDDDQPVLLEYQLVRNLQWANNYSAACNKIITDFNALIATAEAELNDDMNQDGDKETFEGEISAAQLVIGGILPEATDDTYETDSITLAGATETLNQAIQTFKASAEMKPIINIDFSNGFTKVTEIDPETEEVAITGYYVEGVAGKMEFSAASVDTLNTTDVAKFQLGYQNTYNDALRIGNGEALVTLPEIPADGDVIRVQFDMWHGGLTGKYVWFDLRNANGERVAGYKFNRYNGVYEYNDFNNAEGTGMNPISLMTDTKKNADVALHVDGFKTSHDLIIDYKANTVQGTVTSGSKQNVGVVVPLTKALVDNKIVSFVVGSNYNNTGRRCWFDNLKIFKYASSATEEDPVSINAVANSAEGNVAAGIYTISGAKVNNYVKGINIVKMQNGQVKKVFVK